MVNRMQFYIDGAWVDPVVKKSIPVINPATEEAMYEVALGSKADVDKAVAAAKRAFETFSQTSREERIALLEKIIEVYKAPHEGHRRRHLRRDGRAAADGRARCRPAPASATSPSTLEVLKNYHFEENVGTAVVVREPVGVVGMITPVELAAEPDRLQGRAGARRRLHHDPEAVRVHADLGADLRRNPA